MPWHRILNALVAALVAGTLGALAGCASVADAPRLSYLCPNELSFEARLYQDMAILEGLRGHVILARMADGPASATPASAAAEGDERQPDTETSGQPAEGLAYADETVRAWFGLGVHGRLARLDYTTIPEPVYCERRLTTADDPPVAAAPREGPRPPPPPPDPNAPVQTNIRFGEGPIDGG